MRLGVFAGTLRGLFSRQVAEIGATNLFLLLVLALITFYPLLFVGFTTNDDAMFAIDMGNGDIWGSARQLSEGGGRFGFFWNYALSQIPFAVDNRVWYLATKFGSSFLLIGALYYAVFQSFRSSWIALATLVFFLAFIQNGWDHNALTSYALVFNVFAAFFLVSLGLFSTAIDRKSLPLAGLSAGLYFFALANEFFVLFFPFYVAVLLSQAAPGESVTERLRSGKKYILTVALTLIVYLAIYILWRSIYPGMYDGNRPDGFNLFAAGKVVATFSLSALPLASLHFIVSPDDQLLFANSTGLNAILSELNAAHFIKPAVAGFLVARLMTSARFIVPPARTLIIGAALAMIGIFLPNLLLAFTQKYQRWVATGINSYVYTYHSFIAAVVTLALVLAYMNAKSRSWHPSLRGAFILMGVLVTMTLSFVVEVRNQYIAFDQKLSHRKWQLMDVVINSPAFREIPDGSTVVAPTLAAHHRGIAVAPNDYWSKYTKYKTGKNVQFVDDKCKSGAPCYSFVFRQEQHSDNQFIVLAKINHPDLQDSSELTIYSMPNQANAVLMGSFMPGEVSPKLLIDGLSVAKLGIGLFSSNLPHVSGEALVQTARVTGNVDISPNNITISHYSVEPRMWRPLSVELADGIDFKKQSYPEFLSEVSGMSGIEPWGRWTDAAAGPVARFRFKQALPRRFTLEISAGAFGPNIGVPVKVRVGGVEKIFVITNKSESDPYRLAFETDGTADTLEIVPPTPTSPNEIDPKNGDTRKLGIALRLLTLTEN